MALSDDQIDELMLLTASSRVGGAFWGRQPELPDADYILVRVRDVAARSRLLHSLPGGRKVIVWLDSAEQPSWPDTGRTAHTVIGCCDPWHLVSGAEEIYADADDELSLIAALSGRPLHCVGEGPFKGLDKANGEGFATRKAFRAAILERTCFVSPFSERPMSPFEAIQLCRHWRDLIDRNRGLAGAIGFARWKRSTVAPLLWGGSGPIPFVSRPIGPPEGAYAVWRSRASPARLAEFERLGHRLIEVEDGFIRSVGLGADCVPPLSLVVDDLGIYFDPDRPSELERLLQDGAIPSEAIDRAKRLRQLIVEQGVGKYGSNAPTTHAGSVRPASILVPGQVENDRSIICGGGEVRTNLELLRRVRADAPNAHIIYKPHPDVEAGHRPGSIPDNISLTVANEVVRDRAISELFAEVEAVHVNTSLAGFEALLRGKPVTTYGAPFYAGWGLTRDLGAVPTRRTARRTLDELVAAALLIYPRYIDPVTGLPCPAEVLLDRLSQSPQPQRRSMLVPLRRLQGRMRRLLSSTRAKLA